MQPSLIARVITGLKLEYGEPELRLRPDAVGVLVQTILSQNTSDINSDKAFSSLQKKFRDWDDVSKASIDAIAVAIQQGGLSKIKAAYIRDSLNGIRDRLGMLNLGSLKQMPVEKARTWLLQLPGVGLKTANCVLLFSLGMPALPVDTHIYRVSKRLGLIRDISVNEAHSVLEKLVPVREIYTFHILMIKHGRNRCRSLKPDCLHCIVSSLCPSCKQYIQGGFCNLRAG